MSACVGASVPRTARALDCGPAPGVIGALVMELGLGEVVGASTLVFAIADIVYAAKDERMPAPWAISELALGAGLNYGLAAFLLGLGVPELTRGGGCGDGGPELVFGLALPSVAIGTWFLVHSLYNLFASPDEANLVAMRRLTPVVTASSFRDGAAVGLRWDLW